MNPARLGIPTNPIDTTLRVTSYKPYLIQLTLVVAVCLLRSTQRGPQWTDPNPRVGAIHVRWTLP